MNIRMIHPDASGPGRVTTGVLLLVLAMLTAGCSDIFRSTYDYASVEVRAVDDAGAPVRGVELTLYFGEYHHDFGWTGADGKHTFRFVPEGAYGVAATTPDGYALPEGEEWYRILGVEKGGSASVEFTYERVGQ